MIDDKTWLRAVRRVSRPGLRRNEYDLEVDSSVLYNPVTRETRSNPVVTGELVEAPTGATYELGVLLPDGYRYALTQDDTSFLRRVRLGPGSPVRVSHWDSDQFASILRKATLDMNGLCSGCWQPVDGGCGCPPADASQVISNPQLQVLGDYTRRNPWFTTRRNFSGPTGLLTPDTMGALRKFHGKASGGIVSEYDNGDGKDVDLAYLGHVPAIAWLSNEKGASKKQIDVNGELVRFSGFRRMFRGQSRPILALHTPTNEAVVVQGTVESLRDRCDDSGVLGFSPVVEYIVDAVKNSSKGSYHYVHEFEKEYEPVLRWDEAMCGLVYDRDRSLGFSRKAANPKFNRTAVYEVSDWFHEGRKRHRERS